MFVCIVTIRFNARDCARSVYTELIWIEPLYCCKAPLVRLTAEEQIIIR